jgi:hypothetical protein
MIAPIPEVSRAGLEFRPTLFGVTNHTASRVIHHGKKRMIMLWRGIEQCD